MLGYVHSNFSGDSEAANGSGDSVSLGAYAGRLWGPVALKLGAAYTWNMVSTTRTIAFPGFWDQAKSDYTGGTAQAFADLSYRFTIHGVSAAPFADLAYINQSMPSFNENGFGGAALYGASSDIGVTFGTLGLRLAKEFTLARYGFEIDASLGYRHAFGSVTPTTSENFRLGGATFETAGVPVTRNAALISLGARTRLSDSLTLGAAYFGEYGGSYSQSGVKANAVWSF
jgi:outer membrane autotransporter protein